MSANGMVRPCASHASEGSWLAEQECNVSDGSLGDIRGAAHCTLFNDIVSA